MQKLIRNGLALMLVLGCTLALTGCGGGSTGQAYKPRAGGSTGGGGSDTIRTGDKLLIRLTGVPEENIGVYEETVDNDGMIAMPLVGKFRAAGTTTTALKAQIESAYISRRIYSSPNISINQSERYVSVNGEVRLPQRVLYSTDLTALGAISAAGGFTDYANKSKVKISRHGQVIFFNAREAQRNPNMDVPLQAGDQVQVDRSIF